VLVVVVELAEAVALLGRVVLAVALLELLVVPLLLVQTLVREAVQRTWKL
jgi:hypothetical protein